MAINYNVIADVINIREDLPEQEDVFLVDTNVWFWMTYTRASLESRARPQIQYYPSFVNKAIEINAQLYICELSFSELAHTIEKMERGIFKKTNGPIKTKEYRHNCPTERLNVVNEVEAAWGQVKTMASTLSIIIDQDLTDAALIRFKTECVDGYDLFFLEAMSNKKIIKIITDDGDFVTVPGIQVFTANQNVIEAARQQGKLRTK